MNKPELIAEGGFGRVEKVKSKDGGFVARKTFRVRPDIAAIADTEKLRRRFAREVRVQSKLPPDKFIPVLSHGLEDDPPWFTMPLADRSFEVEIAAARKAQTSPKEALAQILEAMEYLQTLQMTHRDLKPSNILLHKGRWKLSDFGFAAVPPGETTRITTTLTPFGTAAYCAPEQLSQFGSVTPAADIYSFGCILHDIFDGSSRIPFAKQTCNGPLGMVVEVCTHGDPSKRFKSIAGLRSALFSVLSAPSQKSSNPTARKIVLSLENHQSITNDDIEHLRRFIRIDQDSEDLWAVFNATTEDVLSAIHKSNPEAWTEIAERLCIWARGGFDYAYCDVIIGRLECIFKLGSLQQKAAAALAAAELGASHNRWLVMRRLHQMCGPSIDASVARRIAIEIRADEAESNFIRCAGVVGCEPSSVYHELIAAELSDGQDDPS